MMAGASPFLALQSQARAAAVWTAAVNAVAMVSGRPVPTEPGVLRGGRRHTREEVELRKLALYTAACGLGCSPKRVAMAAGLHKRWVVEIVRAMEERREDAGIDDLLTRLERQARALMGDAASGQTAERAA